MSSSRPSKVKIVLNPLPSYFPTYDVAKSLSTTRVSNNTTKGASSQSIIYIYSSWRF
jgi:hypothetical protein